MRIQLAFSNNELGKKNAEIGDLKREIGSLRREIKKKDPFFRIGVNFRLGFVEGVNRVRIKGNMEVVKGDLVVDREIVQARIEAAHRGNMVADASLFDPELGIECCLGILKTFCYLYDCDTR